MHGITKKEIILILIAVIFTVVITTVVIILVQEPVKNRLYSDNPRLVAHVDSITIESFEPFIHAFNKQEFEATIDDSVYIDDIKSFFIVRLENKGLLEAEDVIMTIPGKGWFNKNDSNEMESFNESINLGSLKQGDIVDIEIWSQKYNSSLFFRSSFFRSALFFRSSGLSISSKNGGEANVKFSVRAYGWKAFFVQYTFLVLYVQLVFLCTIFIAYNGIRKYLNKNKNKNSDPRA